MAIRQPTIHSREDLDRLRGGDLKVCTKCGEEMVCRSAFHVRKEEANGEHRFYYRSRCKKCLSDQSVKYLTQHRDKANKYGRTWMAKNAEKRRKQMTDYARNKRRTDHQFRIRSRLSSQMGMMVRRSGVRKVDRSSVMLGCTVKEFMQHIESLWRSGMSWDNHGKGRGCWHIDHIKPCASFDLTEKSQQLECFHYTNLQPLWAEENWAKNRKHNHASNQ